MAPREGGWEAREEMSSAAEAVPPFELGSFKRSTLCFKKQKGLPPLLWEEMYMYEKAKTIKMMCK